MRSTTWLRVLIAAVAIDIGTFVALAWWTSGPGDGELSHSALSVVELLCQLVIAGALLAVTRSMVQFQHERFRDQQVLAAAASTTPDWLWETNAEHRVTYSSPGVEHLLGYRPDELVGQATRDLVSPSRTSSSSRSGSPTCWRPSVAGTTWTSCGSTGRVIRWCCAAPPRRSMTKPASWSATGEPGG